MGAPEKPDTKCAGEFLFEFLSDKRVLSLPQPLRATLAYVIARKRKHAYAKSLEGIFRDGVHPLKANTEALARKAWELDGRPVYVAYRYGKNNIPQTIDALKRSGTKYFLFMPLYPQQTRATSESAAARIRRVLPRRQYKIAKPYFDDPSYISALASTVPSKCETLVVSYHSIPLQHAKNSPYVAQCRRTTELLARTLGLRDVHMAWQSAMPRGEWLAPSTSETVEKLARGGRKSLTVIAPSFACDCSETLVELGRDLRKKFEELGGEKFFLCHSLNDSDAHARLVLKTFRLMEKKL